jgi:hypothetical protein
MIQFEANKPQILSLKDSSEACIEGFYVLYETSDGRTLALPRPAAIKLNMLDPGPGEEISITKYRKSNEPAEWVVALTPRSEQIREVVRFVTKVYELATIAASEYTSRGESIPAHVQSLLTSARQLNESGEQWSEQSRQDLCSTVLIAAAKAGLLGVWER